MILEFVGNAIVNISAGFGNTLLNGFASDVSEADKARQAGLKPAHFKPISNWTIKKYEVVDNSTGDKYYDDSERTVRLKCAALFFATWIVQPIGLSLNLLNRIAKIVTFAHLWNPSQGKYHFKARIGEWRKDILLVVSTPLILVGMVFSSFFGAILSPYDGRKLYASFERLAYSGGYRLFSVSYSDKNLQDCLLATCFQPGLKAHLGGGKLGESDVW